MIDCELKSDITLLRMQFNHISLMLTHVMFKRSRKAFAKIKLQKQSLT